MNRYTSPALAILILTACSGMAAETAELRVQVDVLSARIQQTVRALRASPEAQQRLRAAEAARRAREERELSLPGIRELDRQMEALHKSLSDLNRTRSAIVRSHSAELDALDEAALAAEHAHAMVTVRSPEVQALVAERNRLERQLENTAEALAPSPAIAQK